MFETLENRRLFSVDLSGSYAAAVAGSGPGQSHDAVNYATDQVVGLGIASFSTESGNLIDNLTGGATE